MSQAATCALALVRAYAITLDDMVSESHISVNEADSVTLVDSALSLKGRVGAVTGDATSALHWDRIRGSVTFNNSAAEAVVFASPLSSNDYMVIFGAITDRVLPVVTNKTVNGFDITFPQAITQDVLWKIIYKSSPMLAVFLILSMHCGRLLSVLPSSSNISLKVSPSFRL